MSGEAIEKISRAVDDLIHKIGMSGSVRKKWVYDDRCYVVDFKYKGAKFAFDFVPGPAGDTAVDFVPRRRCLALRSHDAAYGGKWRVADNAAPDAALERFSAILGQIRRILNETGSTGSEASASQATGAAGARESLRVGILTLPLNTNFGGNLQAFALADTLRAMGHQTILINRRHAPKNFVEDDGRVEASLARPLLADSIEVERKNRRIAAFVDRHVGPSTPAFHSSRQLARNIGRYGLDAIVVGSDQVWRPQYTRALLEDFFLDFLKDAPAGIRKISYAASFGTDSWEYGQDSQRMAARLLQGFDAVSVREDSGVELCRSQLGRDALHVLDPTLLVSPERYVELFSEKVAPPPEARLVAYILDPSEDRSALLAAISGRLGLPVHSTNGQPYSSGDPLDGTGGDNSVERWLASIHGAEFFVTDSFHGMIFAILFRRPFLVYANPERGLARFTSMLRLLGLEDRLVTQAVETDIDQALRPIDWDEVDRRLDRMRRISTEFLKAALGAVPKPRDLARISKVTNPLGVQCTGCGACVSESRGALRMDWTSDGFLEPVAAADPVPPEAIRVCPFNPAPEPQVADEDALGQLFLGDARHHSGDAGRYENAYVGYSKEFRLTSSSGGIATYVFDRLLRDGIVDHLFVVRGDAENGYAYALFDGSGDIRSISKTRYFPVTLAQLFEIIDGQEGRIGISGVACFIKAVRLKQHYHPELKDKIPFLTGIICGGLKSRHYTDYLAQSAGIPGAYGNAEYRVKNPDSSASDYLFAATDSHDEVHRVRMKRLGDMWGSGLFKSKACDFCTDVTTELADLSLGDAWLPDYAGDGLGHSVIVTRTPLADALIRNGITSGELEAKAVPVSIVVQSQRGGLDHKFKGVRFRSRMVADHTLLPVPHVRTRVQRDLSPGDMLVQVLRERVRARSLRTWNAVQDAGRFTRRMQSSRKILADLTRIRSKNADYIRQMTTAALTDPQREPAYRQGFHSLRVMMRWLRRKLHTGEVSLETLRSLVTVPDPTPGDTCRPSLPVRHSSPPPLAEHMRSVSISVVKNEADIIEAMVRHNCQFLDHMTIVDNGSVDGTWEILQALEAEGLPLSIQQDTRPGHRQVDIVNRFVSGPGCDRSAYVFFLDGDEFISSTKERFNAYLAGKPGNFKLHWKTYVPTETDDPTDPNVLTRIRNRRRHEPSRQRDHKAVLSPAQAGKVEISNGSHSIQRSPMVGQEEIRLAHFPIRSAEQLASKALLGSWNIRLRGRQRTEAFQWFDLADRIRKEGLPDAVQLKAYANTYAADRSFRLVTDPLVSPTAIELRHSGLSRSPLLSAMIQFTDFLVEELEARSREPGR